MDYVETHRKPPVQLFISSNSANVENSKGDLIYYFKNPIEAGQSNIIYANLQQVTMPNTQYNIDSSNNLLWVYYDATDTNVSFTVTEGNYTASTLLTKLNSLLTDIVTTFDSSTLKYTFTSTDEFSFLSDDTYESTIFDILGFDTDDGSALSLNNTLTSDYIINLSGNPSFYFTLQNATTDNVNFINDTVGKSTNVLAKIPFTSKSIGGGIEYYQNISLFRSRLNCHKLDFLHIVLYQDDLTTKYVPDKDWSCVIELTFASNSDTGTNFIKR
jgi:hypothetical protein